MKWLQQFLLGRRLTLRQTEVVMVLMKGLRDSDIALSLGIKTNTVKFHLSVAYRKMNVKSRAQLIALCVAENLKYQDEERRKLPVGLGKP